MARNDINLDQIRARLGDLNKKPQRDPYEALDDAPSGNSFGGRGGGGRRGGDDEDGDGEDKPLSVTFMASIGAVCVAIFGGIFFMPADFSWSSLTDFTWKSQKGSSTAYIPSVVDEECKMKEWVKDTQNADIMHCVLTTRVSRLCDASEKKALVATVLRFQEETDAFQRDMFLAVADMSLNTPMADKMQLGLEAAKADNAKNQQDADRHETNAANIAQGIMAKPNAVLARQKYLHWQIGDHQRELADLAKGGLITRSDFPYYVPKWVEAAFTDVQPKATPCKS